MENLSQSDNPIVTNSEVSSKGSSKKLLRILMIAMLFVFFVGSLFVAYMVGKKQDSPNDEKDIVETTKIEKNESIAENSDSDENESEVDEEKDSEIEDNDEDVDQSELNTYTNPAFGYSFKYQYDVTVVQDPNKDCVPEAGQDITGCNKFNFAGELVDIEYKNSKLTLYATDEQIIESLYLGEISYDENKEYIEQFKLGEKSVYVHFHEDANNSDVYYIRGFYHSYNISGNTIEFDTKIDLDGYSLLLSNNFENFDPINNTTFEVYKGILATFVE